MKKIKEIIEKFFNENPDLKSGFIGLSFLAVAVWGLLTLLFSFHGPESILEDVLSAFGYAAILLIIVIAIILGIFYLDKAEHESNSSNNKK